jgi:hypothetical protein
MVTKTVTAPRPKNVSGRTAVRGRNAGPGSAYACGKRFLPFARSTQMTALSKMLLITDPRLGQSCLAHAVACRVYACRTIDHFVRRRSVEITPAAATATAPPALSLLKNSGQLEIAYQYGRPRVFAYHCSLRIVENS